MKESCDEFAKDIRVVGRLASRPFSREASCM